MQRRALGGRLGALLPTHRFRLASVPAEERVLAGHLTGILYLIGAATFAAFPALPIHSSVNFVAPLVITLCALTWGVCSLRMIDWQRTSWWVIHASAWGALAAIGIAIAFTGGAKSMCWIYLFYVVLFAAYFFSRPVAVLYVGLCLLTHASVLLYEPHAFSADRFGAQLLLAGTGYISLAGAIMAGKQLMLRLRERAEGLAAEQSALRRVATAVVDRQPPAEIYELVSRETAALLDASGAGILRLEGPSRMIVVGSWSRLPSGRYAPGTVVPVRPGGEVEEALRDVRSVRVVQHAPDSYVDQLGYSSSIVSPIRVAGRVWGLLAVAVEGIALTAEDEERLEEIRDLLATAIASIEDRAKLASQASSDPLTGLANHRTLHEQLAAEVSRAHRSEQVLSVAVLDIDNFKHFNDVGGHEAGDRLLLRVADCLRQVARSSDTLGRVGGDEFAWILPDTTREAALVAVERARQLAAARVSSTVRITLSAGICDLSVTDDPAELIRFADGALYWSKAHGRDQAWIYDPAVVDELSAQERAERLARSQALLGIRALARAIDAKDPATRQHSERVAALAHQLAQVSGWSPEQALQLSEAALVHDVGKIGVPDSTLRQTAPLTDAERAQIRGHAELSARIVEGVLSPEQVDWIRTHHERPDGTGYPRGLVEHEIPEGATLLALADAWDVMTVSRPYSLPKSIGASAVECRSLVGQQFTAKAVAALEQLHDAGALDPTPDSGAPVLDAGAPAAGGRAA